MSDKHLSRPLSDFVASPAPGQVAPDNLVAEIVASAVCTAPGVRTLVGLAVGQNHDGLPDLLRVRVVFDAVLDDDELVAFDAVVAAHTGIP